jgi:3-oxoacyl-[acyl-carrier protein] reductase
MTDTTRRSRRDDERPVALITGGTRGIGLGVARALAAEGWNLALSGLRATTEVAPVIDELDDHGGTVKYWAADVARADDRAQLIQDVGEKFGGLDALVNNAGRAPRVRADLLDAREESFADLLRTNLQGPYFLTQAAAPLLIERCRQRPDATPVVVFVTSVSAEMISTNRGEYCVSKAGLAMAAQLFAARLAAEGVAVFDVRPGIIATDMTAAVKDAYDRRIADGLVPDRRWGEPTDVGRVVAALLRGDLPFSTGSIIRVDGGLSIPRL